VFLIRQPTDAVIHAFLQVQARLDFTYPDTGATAVTAPASYVVDHTRIRLGTGEEIFHRAKISLEGWKQFDLGWLKAYPADTPIRSGELVAVVACTFGLWSLNAARIVYVVDEPRRFGFAYGTLPGHVERGEERFLVEQTDDNSVWYDILAFSQPRHLLTKIGYPLVRRLQRRFGRESAATMVRAVTVQKPQLGGCSL
jgi:uncharacterized protein (UPF0548 family)